MSNTLPYAVFGATGRTGAAAADALLRAGLPVRVVLRDPPGRAWAARGAEIVQADLTDADALTRVLTGVRGAYVVSPQQYGRADLFELADRIAQTVRAPPWPPACPSWLRCLRSAPILPAAAAGYG